MATPQTIVVKTNAGPASYVKAGILLIIAFIVLWLIWKLFFEKDDKKRSLFGSLFGSGKGDRTSGGDPSYDGPDYDNPNPDLAGSSYVDQFGNLHASGDYNGTVGRDPGITIRSVDIAGKRYADIASANDIYDYYRLQGYDHDTASQKTVDLIHSKGLLVQKGI